MSGANYAHCDHCGTKVFYDADTEVGDAAIFHGECLPKHDAAVAAKALREAAPRFRQPRRAASVWAEILDLADQIEAGD